MGNIYVLDGDKITELRETLYENEDFFQSLIERYPNILAGDQINPSAPRKWILISREMGVPAETNSGDKWSLDHLFADQDAIPTFVEVKRSTDTRLRREVVAQMLDYAANGSEYWSMEKIRLSFEKSCEKSGVSLADIDVSDGEEEEYWRVFENNLRTGKIRLIFAADEIPMELRRIIEFLNDQMKDTEVIGLEIKQYTSGGAISTLVPRIVGQTAKAMDIKSGVQTAKIKWSEETFLEDAAKIDGGEAAVCKRIIDTLKGAGCGIDGGKTSVGSVWGSSVILYYGKSFFLNLYVYKEQLYAAICLQYLREPLDSDERQLELINKFNDIPGIVISKDKLHKRPSISLSILTDNAALAQFIKIYTEIVDVYKGIQK
jgi:hypothetical protein